MITDPRLRALASALAAINAAYRAGQLPLWWTLELYASALRAYQEGAPMAEIRTIRLDPPQPCGVLDPARPGACCGKPATTGTAGAAPRHLCGPAGYLLVLPICEDCARAMARNRATQIDTTPATADLIRRN